MKNVEIPLQAEKDWKYRFFEMLPGILSWSLLAVPFVLSLINPGLTVFFIIAYLLMWFTRAIGLNIRVIQGWLTMRQHQKLPWPQLLNELEASQVESPHAIRPDWHYDNILRTQAQPLLVKPSELFHAIIMAVYNESREVIEPSIQAILASNYDMDKVIFVLAYEGRDGAQSEPAALALIDEYGPKFKHALAIKHPLTEGEMRGKGGNITFAGRKLKDYIDSVNIDLLKVVVTTLDADHRPHTNYLAALTYTYCVCPDPVHISFQPIPMFTNNIWDAPAPMRVIATGNSFWMIVQALRPHILRNFASHAQSLQTLIDTDFWSVRTIVEDGHQFWRTYFRYDGNHEVYPIFLPIYQDAVLAATLRRTLKAQFIQIRRWAWGASDIAYVVHYGFLRPNHISKPKLLLKLGRLLEGHVSWATAPLILIFSGYIPAFFNPQNVGALRLPLLAQLIQRVAMAGIAVTLFLSFKTLPPKPSRYKAHRNVFMVLQWAYLPFTSILYSSFAALYSQTRLMIGKYIGKFDVTEKAVKTNPLPKDI